MYLHVHIPIIISSRVLGIFVRSFIAGIRYSNFWGKIACNFVLLKINSLEHRTANVAFVAGSLMTFEILVEMTHHIFCKSFLPKNAFYAKMLSESCKKCSTL